MKKTQSEVKQVIMTKLDIIKNGVDAASHKVAKEKMGKAADWLVEIHEQVKKLREFCDHSLN